MSLIWSESIENVDWHELAALYRAAPLGNKDPEQLRTAFTNSRFTWFVYENATLIAVGRALADGVDCSYICDVAVMPSHQRMGLGKQIVAKLIEQSRDHQKILLYAVPGKEDFYRKLGFVRMTTAMAIFADQTLAQTRGYLSDS
jgi:ribosomal protein S18 acetylase RimI-like enzyme